MSDAIDPDVLAAYSVPEPAADLGDRFAARLAALPPKPRPQRGFVLGGIVLAAAAAVVLIGFALRHGTGAESAGMVTAAERTTARLGTRGVAVVEAGGQLTWRIAGDGAAQLEQRNGNVFYRVEPGEPFAVSTPGATVVVRGTCFRIEVAAEIAVTVYEGAVDITNARGQVRISAGERATTAADRIPKVAAAAAPDPIVAELSARDRSQRDKLAVLEARIARLETTPEPAHPFELSAAELRDLADRCSVPVDVPPTAGSTLMDQVMEEGARDAKLSDAERAAVKRVIAKLQPRYQTELQGLYRERTGDDAELDPLALIVEITGKSAPADIAVAYQRVSAERAGLRRPPADPAAGSVIERYLRFALVRAADFERELANEIGADRARAYRRTWGGVHLTPGCPPPEKP